MAARLSLCIWSKGMQLQLAVEFGLRVLSFQGGVRVCVGGGVLLPKVKRLLC